MIYCCLVYLPFTNVSIITAKILICFCLGKIFSEKKPDICVDARFLWYARHELILMGVSP